jgi:hypothetical protein
MSGLRRIHSGRCGPSKLILELSPKSFTSFTIARNFDHIMMVAPMSTLDPIQRYTRRTHTIPASLPQQGDVSVRRELDGPLRLSVHDYSVLGSSKDGVTVILTHGTSFNKYFWELLINYMLSQKDVRTNIKRFIAIDAANHGDSAVLNREVLPPKGEFQ